MAKQTVNIGSAPNDGTGDPARTAFDKINDNFNETYGVSGILKSNGTDTLSAAVDGTDFISSVALDTTPQLGGDLDGQSTYDLNNILNVDVEGYADFTEIAEPAAPGATQIRLWAEADSGKSMLKYQNGDGVVRELGRDLVHIVRNTTGAQIDKGDWVYISGANGSLPTVALADASDSTKMPAFGVALENIGNNSNGFVLSAGDIGGLDTSGFTQGDILYISASTPGAVTATEPTGTNIDQQVGVVISSNAGSGIISVDVKGAFDPTLTSTLTNKTLTNPVIAQINDANGNEALTLAATASAVNYLDIANSATGNDVTLSAAGSDTDVGVDISPKGAGNVTLGNFVLDADQSIGVGQDNYVLTYDNATGLISLEAAAGGGGTPGGSSGQLQYNNAGAFGGVNLWRADANTIEQYNGTNAQSLRIYNTRTDASNYERGFIGFSGNAFIIDVQQAGTGSARELVINRGGAVLLETAGSATVFSNPGNSSEIFRYFSGNIYPQTADTGLGRPADGFKHLYLDPQSADPGTPNNGVAVMWTGTGAGTGADGDILFSVDTSAGTNATHILPHTGATTDYIALSDGGTGGSGSAGAGNQYIEININGTTYKVLHDGTV